MCVTKCSHTPAVMCFSGEFENGVAKGEVKEELQPVAAFRLVVHSDSDVWAVLSEV